MYGGSIYNFFYLNLNIECGVCFNDKVNAGMLVSSNSPFNDCRALCKEYFGIYYL